MKKLKFSFGILALICVILSTTIGVITLNEMQLFGISFRDILLTILMSIALIFFCVVSAFLFYECGEDKADKDKADKDKADEERPPS